MHLDIIVILLYLLKNYKPLSLINSIINLVSKIKEASTHKKFLLSFHSIIVPIKLISVYNIYIEYI